MKLKTLAILAFCAIASAARAQSDPYATGQRDYLVKQYLQERSDYADRMTFLNFAVGCRVIPSWQGLDTGMDALQNAWLRAGGQQAVGPLDFGGLWRDGRMRGQAEAAKPGACQYFADHPDVVARLRDQARQPW